MNAVIACGGTGGHLFPGIAVAEVLRDRGHEVMLLISEKDIDALALSGRTNFQVEKLPSIGLPSAFSPAFFGFIRRFYDSLSLCRSLVNRPRDAGMTRFFSFTMMVGRIRGATLFTNKAIRRQTDWTRFSRMRSLVRNAPTKTRTPEVNAWTGVRLDRKVTRQNWATRIFRRCS